MTMVATPSVEAEIVALSQRARAASRQMSRSTAEQRRHGLLLMADALEANTQAIVEANTIDVDGAVRAGLSAPMQDRLRMDAGGVARLAAAVREVAGQDDVVGEITEQHIRPNGLSVGRMSIPLGVVAMIYESRPNVTADAAALCVKSANAAVLRGGKEAFHSNRAIAEALRTGLEASDLPADAVQLVGTTDRAAIDVLLHQVESIDLVIPRGGEGLIRAVTEKSRIPVLQHYKGVCHVFVDREADLAMAEAIVINAKVQRPGVCNSLETLLVHRDVAAQVLPDLGAALGDAGVEIRGCPVTCELLPSAAPATEADWDAEYLDLILAVRVVDGMEGALDHIADHASSHTEAIVTDDAARAQTFVASVQSSTVLVNASTRFADGGELGLGAEIGISTSKLHAYGPMGARELTTRKFVVFGTGQVRN